LEEIGRIGSEHDIRHFVGLARQVWLRRNGFIHDRTFAHPDLLVRKAYSSIDEDDATCSRDGLVREPVGEMEKGTWQAPPNGVHKANWDAALNHQSERIDIGIVVRDQEGNVRATQCVVRSGRFELSIAETIAAVQSWYYVGKLVRLKFKWKVMQKTLWTH
jgi:hypothetical protein